MWNMGKASTTWYYDFDLEYTFLGIQICMKEWNLVIKSKHYNDNGCFFIIIKKETS